MKPFQFTRQADQDVDEIWEYISADNVEAAGRVPKSEPSQIIRVLHAARDVQSILSLPWEE